MWWRICATALAACLATMSGAAPAIEPEAATATSPATWYWQNPLPRGYQLSAIACRSAASCLATGFDGDIVTTDDGGQHWTNRASGINAGLSGLACAGPTICYAMGSQVPAPGGSSQTVTNVVLASVDGGATWQTVSHFQGNTDQSLGSFDCPSPATCLIVVSTYGQQQAASILRTTDGGKTWQDEGLAGADGISTVACPTTTICYALGETNSGTILFRSGDAGKTWSSSGLRAPKQLRAIACPGENTCFGTAWTCSSGCWGIFRTANGAKSWTKVADNPAGHLPGDLACPSITTCYALAASGSNFYNTSVVGTSNGGKTWSEHHLPDSAFEIVCSGQTACFLNAGFAVLATQDAFGHTHETLARSPLHNLTLTDMSCPSTTTCYAAGFRHVCDSMGGECDQVASPSAATANGGRTWTKTPAPPDLVARLSCASTAVCYSIAGETGATGFVERSGDGARTWQRVFPSGGQYGVLTDISCPSITTCYVTASVTGRGVPLAMLVTRDGGKTWAVQRAVDALAPGKAATAGPGGRALVRVSCPTVTTCFVLAASFHQTASNPQSAPQLAATMAMLVTTNGGTTWTRKSVPDMNAGDDPGLFTPPLACPTPTTCYLLLSNGSSLDPSSTGAVLVTHNGGASWRRVFLQAGAILTDIACPSADSCRVVGWGAIFATADGGTTWQSQAMADGAPVPQLAGIACPAADTCYAVGGSFFAPMTIVGTHAP